MELNDYQKKAKKTDQFKSNPDRSLASSFWNLHETVGTLSRLYDERDRIRKIDPDKFKKMCSIKLGDMLWYCAAITDALGLDLEAVAESNLEKCKTRWGAKAKSIALFDEQYPEDEQLPRKIIFKLHETKQGLTRLAIQRADNKWHQLGSRVTDNSHTDDGYRYHDALHIAYMAILGWSPVMRSLLVCKRKSNSNIDEVEDGARAANLEEALTALIYEHAKTVNFFAEEEFVPFELLKWVERLTRGLEAHQITYEMWSKAILEGYRIWRELRKNNGGYVEVNMVERSIIFRPLK